MQTKIETIRQADHFALVADNTVIKFIELEKGDQPGKAQRACGLATIDALLLDVPVKIMAMIKGRYVTLLETRA